MFLQSFLKVADPIGFWTTADSLPRADVGWDVPVVIGGPEGISAQIERGVLARKREFYHHYYNERVAHIFDFFEENDYFIPSLLFKKRIEQKSNKLRKNDYKPDISHEVDLLLAVIRLLQNDEDFKKLLPALEERYLFSQRVLNAIILHDVGEEEGWFAEDVEKEILHGLRKMGQNITQNASELISWAGMDMERLTDCRKFKIADFETLVGEKVDINDIKPGEVFPLDEYKGFFWGKMDILPDDDNQNMAVFVHWDTRKPEPKIVVTRYNNCPDNKRVPGWRDAVDAWLYHRIVARDFVTQLVKRLDTNLNIATLLEKGDSPERMLEYISDKENGWGDMNAYEKCAQEPLMDDYIECLDQMRQKLMKNVSRYCLFARDVGGKKDSVKMNGLLNGVYLDYSFFFPDVKNPSRDCNKFYKYTDLYSHPIFENMEALRRAPDLSGVGHFTVLYDAIKKGTIKAGGKEMESLLQKQNFVSLEEITMEYDAPDGYEYVEDSCRTMQNWVDKVGWMPLP